MILIMGAICNFIKHIKNNRDQTHQTNCIINNILPRGTQRSKSYPGIGVMVHPKDKKRRIEMMTESATEWKKMYMKSKKLYQYPLWQQIRNPRYLNIIEIRFNQMHEITRNLAQSVSLDSKGLDYMLLSISFNIATVPTIRTGNQQQYAV